MKRFILVLLITIFTIALTACGSVQGGTSGKTDKAEKDGTEVEDNNWAEANGLYETETVEELYEKAKEEGKVVIYSRGSKFKEVKISFEEEYPGITVEPYKMDGMEIREKLTREHDAGVFNADIIHSRVEQNLYKDGYLHPYNPDDINEKFSDDYKDLEHPVQYLTVNPIIYNTEVYDEPPISNWWDLTDEEWKGRVLLNDPVSNVTYSELFIAIINNSDEMEAAYEEKYGKPIELTEENAGYEFIKKFLENDPVLMSSGEDIIESVGRSSQEKPPIGFTSSSKLRHIEQSGLPIKGTFDVSPRVSVLGSYVVYIADKAPHPNAAKLMARWAMGEADGNSPGLDPFNLHGVWVPRTDVENLNEFPVEDIKAWSSEQEFYDKTFPVFRNFWLTYIN